MAHYIPSNDPYALTHAADIDGVEQHDFPTHALRKVGLRRLAQGAGRDRRY
jgi:hypothetical protein